MMDNRRESWRLTVMDNFKSDGILTELMALADGVLMKNGVSTEGNDFGQMTSMDCRNKVATIDYRTAPITMSRETKRNNSLYLRGQQ